RYYIAIQWGGLPMCRIAALTMLAASVLLTTPDPARADDKADCASSNPELAILGCTKQLAKSAIKGRDRATVLANRAMAYSAKQQFEQAMADANRAVQTDPKYAFAYYARSLVYVRQNDLDRSLAELNRALEIDQKFARAFEGRGSIHLR